MELHVVQRDPLGVLASTKFVVERARRVSICPGKLKEAAAMIARRFEQGLDNQDLDYVSTGSIERDVQAIFLEDAVNFCFWAAKDRQKWQVELESGEVTQGGWHGLSACFKRALKENVSLLDAAYVALISDHDARKLLRGVGGVEIPLLRQRADILRETGAVLLKTFSGAFMNILTLSDFDSAKLISLVKEHFSSFRDVSVFHGKDIVFLKRAQILCNDLDRVMRPRGRAMKGLEELTAFADYKLPQVLRMFGVLEYDKELADKVDAYIEISHDSVEEIEIRASTIWAVELLRQMIPRMSAGDIDNTIWVMSQSIQDRAKPYHRTRTIYY